MVLCRNFDSVMAFNIFIVYMEYFFKIHMIENTPQDQHDHAR